MAKSNIDKLMELKQLYEQGILTKEEMEIEKEGEEIIIGFNPKFLMDALRVIDDDDVCIYMTDSKNPCMIKDEGENYVYIILPITINTDVYA